MLARFGPALPSALMQLTRRTVDSVGVLGGDARVDQRVETGESDPAAAFHTPKGGGAAQRCEDRERSVGSHLAKCKRVTRRYVFDSRARKSNAITRMKIVRREKECSVSVEAILRSTTCRIEWLAMCCLSRCLSF